MKRSIPGWQNKMDLGEILYHPAKENVTFKEGKAYDFQLEKTLDERVC